MFKKSGFTLIELLIVVAIIAILAAIAVPNFLEAQTRAKASRVKSDLRSAITAIESYAVDHNKYPVPRYIEKQQTPLNSGAQFLPGGFHQGGIAGTFHTGEVAGVTSPIAYMTSIPKDPFATGVFDTLHDDMPYMNINIWCTVGIPLTSGEATRPGGGGVGQANWFDPNSATGKDLPLKYGHWIVRSIGPDKTFNSAQQPYDPTNGTVSWGDIYRTHNRSRNNRAIGGE